MRAAFDATVKDADFLRDAANLNREIIPASGVELQQLVAGIVNADAKAIDTLNKLIGELGK